jgi:hypothetical protein
MVNERYEVSRLLKYIFMISNYCDFLYGTMGSWYSQNQTGDFILSVNIISTEYVEVCAAFWNDLAVAGRKGEGDSRPASS